jgi:predicted transcriptional regulator
MMKLTDAMQLIEARPLTNVKVEHLKLTQVGAADLLSDVLAFSKPGFLLLTGQLSIQTLKTAQISEAVAVVFVRGKIPEKEIIKYAEENELPLFSTEKLLFETCGLLFENRLKPC